MNLEGTRIRRNFGGFRCRINGKEFLADSMSKASLNKALRAQLQWTNQIVFDLRREFGDRTIEEYRTLYIEKVRNDEQ